jgi:Outer membrane protein beta-barrel domain
MANTSRPKNKQMKHIFSLMVILLITLAASAQQNTIPKKNQFAELSFGFGSSQGTLAVGYFKNWNLGKKHKFYIGTGARFNIYYGNNINFLSAPASLAAEESKTDTLVAANPSIYALNAMINMGYNFTPKLQIGFNIDLLGFSFGPEGTPKFNSNGGQVNTKAKPTSFNLLLIGNNDKGTLNSEFYLRYKINNKFGFKVAYEYFFTELTTSTKVQTLPEQNDRFRNKANLFNIGVSYHF